MNMDFETLKEKLKQIDKKFLMALSFLAAIAVFMLARRGKPINTEGSA